MIMTQDNISCAIDDIANKGFTPYIAVDTAHPGYEGPTHLSDDNGVLVLNLNASSNRMFVITDDGVEFYSSFSGQEYFIVIPRNALLMIFAHEDFTVFYPNTFEYQEPVHQEPRPVHTGNIEIRLAQEGDTPWRNPDANVNWKPQLV